MLLITNGTFFPSRAPLVAIESVCKHNPGTQFHLYRLWPRTEEDRSFTGWLEDAKLGCSVQVNTLDVETFFIGTPLEPWASRGHLAWLRAQGFGDHGLRSMFRLAVVWKVGGWYIDPDMLVMQPLEKLRNTVCVYKAPIHHADHIGNDPGGPVDHMHHVLGGFAPRHAFVEAAMRQLVAEHDPKKHTINISTRK